jgi:hypothetical protein
MTAEPAGSVVAGSSVIEIYENEILGTIQPRSLYFIDPGTVTVTLLDPVSGASSSQTFTVVE